MPSNKIDIMSQFSGAFNLGNELGTIYLDHEQTGALTFEVAGNPTPGGNALIKIIASGDAINIPAGWIKFGGDDISIVAGDENHFWVLAKDAGTIYYTNKVVTP